MRVTGGIFIRGGMLAQRLSSLSSWSVVSAPRSPLGRVPFSWPKTSSVEQRASPDPECGLKLDVSASGDKAAIFKAHVPHRTQLGQDNRSSGGAAPHPWVSCGGSRTD